MRKAKMLNEIENVLNSVSPKLYLGRVMHFVAVK